MKLSSHFVVRILATSTLVVLTATGCSDDVASGPGDCPDGQEWNPISEQCVPEGDGPDSPDADAGGIDDSDADGNGTGGDDAGGGDDEPDAHSGCEGADCDDVQCNPDEGLTTLTGTVTIPSGELPLPEVTVYVPEDALESVDPGASCEQCGEELSGTPITDTTTNVDGQFVLTDVPAGENIPLVVEVGKWRRVTSVDSVEPCEETAVAPEETRLPRNRDEGEIPQISVTSGACDALACFVRKIGVDDSEFTTEDGNGAVHLFAGDSATDDEGNEQRGTDRFADDFNDGDEFSDHSYLWEDPDNFLDYDIMLGSCECEPNAQGNDAAEAFQTFVDAGGRAFLSHFHYAWLNNGTSDMQSVADWGSFSLPPGGFDPNQQSTGYINDSFPKGQILRDWMFGTGTTPQGEFEIFQVRGSIGSVDDDIVQDWITIDHNGNERIQYFSFNTPLGVAEDNQCGRVVFSDIHVSAREIDGFLDTPDQDVSSPDDPFPTGCVTDDFSDQEKALVYMFFDLSACIIPDGKKPGDW